MKDYRKFCRPKTTKHPEIGDVQVKLNCGNTVYVKAKDYLGIKRSFKIDSIVGETINTAGNIKVLDKTLNKEIIVSPLTYINNLNKFNFIGVVGNINNSEDGNIICHNVTLSQNAIFSYNDWLNLSDDWDLVGLYGITTYEEEDAANGDYVIMANGHTLIIKPEDYSKVSNNWELVDTIGLPNNVIKYTASEKLVETTSVPFYPDKSTGLRTTQFNTSIVDHTFKNGIGTIIFEEDVTEIKKYAFSGNVDITSITIPNSVTSIREGAFSDCRGLTSVTIPNIVTSMELYAFYNCSGLTSITIPNSTTSIGYQAFNGCSSLTSVTVETTTPPTLGNNAIPGNVTNIYVPAESVDAYKAAEGWSTYADKIQAIQ